MRALVFSLTLVFSPLLPFSASAEFTAASAIVDVTPKQFPVLVNGGMTSRSIEVVNRPIHARSLAFSDGEETAVIVVVDSCMMPRDLLDRAKTMASEKSGIPTDRILISATHTHTAPSCMGALGTDADPVYSLFLTKKLVEAILAPLGKMQPARIGWGEIDAGEFTALRRWVIHPDHVQEDPFGNFSVRANMHAAANWDHVIGKSGPEDPMLTLISVESSEGEPIGLLANFSMHYYGDKDISPDYFGLFADGLKEKIAPDSDTFVAMMSHGCSGDIWRHDYEKSPRRGEDALPLEDYAAALIERALEAHAAIEHTVPKSIAMAETRMTLPYRVPDQQRLEWAQRIVAEMGDRLPKTKPEVYAREQILLHEKQETEIVVQALRLGDEITIATTPNETYAISGLKIKNASPAPHTMVIELANGGDGYIPPPEQHLLGGYNTWAARSAGLEVEAEPKIVGAAIALLETVTGKPRTDRRPGHGAAAKHLLSLNPTAYWRLDEFSGPRARDASRFGNDAIYEPKVLFYLPGPASDAFSEGGLNRSAHFAGDRLAARLPGLTGSDYTVSLWFWSGSAPGKIKTFEWLFSRQEDLGSPDRGDHLGLKDREDGTRYLAFQADSPLRQGFDKGKIERWTWSHVVIVRSGRTMQIFLNGEGIYHTMGPEVIAPPSDTFFFGGSSSRETGFEGRLDEIAVFDRALSTETIQEIFAKSRPL